MMRSANTTRLLVVPEPGLVGDNRLAVSSADTPTESAGILTPSPNDPASARPVRLVPVRTLPAGTIAVSEQLARETGLTGDFRSTWLLREEDAVTAASAVVELQTDEPAEAVLRRLRLSQDLDGQVLYVPGDLQPNAVWLTVDGDPYRLRAVSGPDGTPLRGLVRIGTTTELSLFVPAGRSGIDIVVLADCSGSMSWDDVVDTGDVMRGGGGRNEYVTRMKALKRALRQMADARGRLHGRQARVALVQFTTTSLCVFPKEEGMADLSDGGDERLLTEFRQAITVLEAKEAGTEIGQALQYASELLYRYGTPHNDRLIVLVSDGATWSEKGVEKTGEMLAASEDPVSLLEEFHDSLDIRLHAVGISDERSFTAWWDRYHRPRQGDPHISIVPNHQLLRKLVKVGGGDPTRIGGMDVLEEYFSALGRGVTRTIGRPAPGRLQPPQDRISTAAAPGSQPPEAASLARLPQLADRIQDLYSKCIITSKRRVGRPLYRMGDDSSQLLQIGSAVVGTLAFSAWIGNLWKVFLEGQESCLNKQRPDREYEVPGVHELVWDGRLGRIVTLRLYSAHMLRRGNKDEERELLLEVGRIFTQYTGRYHLEDNDQQGWCALQLGLLEDLAELLAAIHGCLNTMPAGPPATPEVASTGSGDMDEPFVSMGW